MVTAQGSEDCELWEWVSLPSETTSLQIRQMVGVKLICEAYPCILHTVRLKND